METKKYHKTDFYFWKITLCLASASFFVFASLYVVQPLLPVFVRDFDISVSEATLTLSVNIVGLIIGLIVLGFFSDRIGRVPFIKYSLLASVIPFLLIPMTDSFYFFILMRFLQGFALAGLPAASLAYINEEIDRSSIGIATALYIASNAFGGMVGRVLAGYLAEDFAWQTIFYIFAGMGVIIVAVVMIFLPKSRFFEAIHLPFRKDIEGMAFHVKNPAMLLIFGMGIIFQLSFTSVWTYLPFHLEGEPFFLSAKAISYTFLAYGFGVVGAPVAGWLAGSLGLNIVRIAGIIILSAGITMTMILSLPWIIVGLCVTCLGFFTAHSLTATFVTEKATHHKGSASSLYLVSYYIGVAFGSTAVGPIWDKAGWNAVVWIAGILPIGYLILVTIIQKGARRSSSSSDG
ncbi:MFS transporter [Oceanobacillus neutriphilus]|uniref:MFS transporter n=1 Tax=Oceanobacillus neutriphilus TaxID=531815 RepID=A0ABQ2NXR9_9BACI|nr:MFS transporter [Oceanobacillus neutriphilus]GGP13101.1 MFS transporter [Oceanobacillus neutriphilus]